MGVRAGGRACVLPHPVPPCGHTHICVRLPRFLPSPPAFPPCFPLLRLHFLNNHECNPPPHQGDVTKLVEDVAALQPSLFLGVPRVFDRIYTRIMGQVRVGCCKYQPTLKQTKLNERSTCRKREGTVGFCRYLPKLNRTQCRRTRRGEGGLVGVVYSSPNEF